MKKTKTSWNNFLLEQELLFLLFDGVFKFAKPTRIRKLRFLYSMRRYICIVMSIFHWQTPPTSWWFKTKTKRKWPKPTLETNRMETKLKLELITIIDRFLMCISWLTGSWGALLHIHLMLFVALKAAAYCLDNSAES